MEGGHQDGSVLGVRTCFVTWVAVKPACYILVLWRLPVLRGYWDSLCLRTEGSSPSCVCRSSLGWCRSFLFSITGCKEYLFCIYEGEPNWKASSCESQWVCRKGQFWAWCWSGWSWCLGSSWIPLRPRENDVWVTCTTVEVDNKFVGLSLDPSQMQKQVSMNCFHTTGYLW